MNPTYPSPMSRCRGLGKPYSTRKKTRSSLPPSLAKNGTAFTETGQVLVPYHADNGVIDYEASHNNQ